MKSVLSWVFDPCVHVILVAVIFVHLFYSGSGAGEAQSTSGRMLCGICLGNVDPEVGCLHPIARSASASR